MGQERSFFPVFWVHGVVLPGFFHFGFQTVQRSALCRSRRELSDEYLLAKFGFDTAENEPYKDCPLEVRKYPTYFDTLAALCTLMLGSSLHFHLHYHILSFLLFLYTITPSDICENLHPELAPGRPICLGSIRAFAELRAGQVHEAGDQQRPGSHGHAAAVPTLSCWDSCAQTCSCDRFSWTWARIARQVGSLRICLQQMQDCTLSR